MKEREDIYVIYKCFSYYLNIFQSLFYYRIDSSPMNQTHVKMHSSSRNHTGKRARVERRNERIANFCPRKIFFPFFSFHLISKKETPSSLSASAEPRRNALCPQRNASHCIGAFAMHQRRTLYRAGPRPFRSPVDRFSAGSTTPALALTNPSLLRRAKKKRKGALSATTTAAHAGHAGHIYRLGRTRTR